MIRNCVLQISLTWRLLPSIFQRSFYFPSLLNSQLSPFCSWWELLFKVIIDFAITLVWLNNLKLKLGRNWKKSLFMTNNYLSVVWEVEITQLLSSASPWWGLAKLWESLDLGASVADSMWYHVGGEARGEPGEAAGSSIFRKRELRRHSRDHRVLKNRLSAFHSLHLGLDLIILSWSPQSKDQISMNKTALWSAK